MATTYPVIKNGKDSDLSLLANKLSGVIIEQARTIQNVETSQTSTGVLNTASLLAMYNYLPASLNAIKSTGSGDIAGLPLVSTSKQTTSFLAFVGGFGSMKLRSGNLSDFFLTDFLFSDIIQGYKNLYLTNKTTHDILATTKEFRDLAERVAELEVSRNLGG